MQPPHRAARSTPRFRRRLTADRAPPVTDPIPPPRARRSSRCRRRPRICGCASARASRSPTVDGPHVAKWEEWYAARPDYVARMVDRSRRYLYYIVVEVEKRDMPLEIALLPMVESAFNPQAVSVSRASGIWQFMPSTGNHYGMKQTFWIDSRRDVIAATEGALTYLQKLHDAVRRLAAGARRLQLGRGQRRAGDREEPEGGPADRLRESRDAGRDAQLPAQAAGGEEHRQRSRPVTASTRRHSGRTVFRGREDDAEDGREAGGGARRDVDRGVPVPQSAPQPAGDRRGRRIHDPAADRQGGALRRQARSRPTSRSCRGRRTGCDPARRCRRSPRSSACRSSRCAR